MHMINNFDLGQAYKHVRVKPTLTWTKMIQMTVISTTAEPHDCVLIRILYIYTRAHLYNHLVISMKCHVLQK